uniref:Putative secreted protein n=1 Tax=Anopheles triannulatus TaxID=58253 RepID=A0A2M4B1M7_9DIPT
MHLWLVLLLRLAVMQLKMVILASSAVGHTFDAANEKLLQIIGAVLEVLFEHLLQLLLIAHSLLLLLFNKPICFGRFFLGNNVLFVDRDLNRWSAFLEVLVRGYAPYDLGTVWEMLLTVRSYQLPVLADRGRTVLALLALPAVLPLGRIDQIGQILIDQHGGRWRWWWWCRW